MAADSNDGATRFDVTISKRAAILTATSIILLGLIFLYLETYNMMPSMLRGYPGDAFFPRLVLAFAMICAVIVLLRSIFLPQEAAAIGAESNSFSLHILEYLSIIALVALYAAFFEELGFEIATVIFLLILLIPRLLMPPLKALLIGTGSAIVTMLILWLAFGPLLGIHLPLKFLPLYL